MTTEHDEQEISLDQLEELMNSSDIDKLPPIEIGFEHYDADEFQRGIDETSYLAGRVTALLNAGLSEATVMDLILSQASIEHNIEVAKINKEMNVEMAKNQRINAEKHEL